MDILFLDDNPYRHDIADDLWSYATIYHCYTIDDLLRTLDKSVTFDIVSLDYDLNDFDAHSTYNGKDATGLDACVIIATDRYRSRLPNVIDVHSSNGSGSSSMKYYLQTQGFDVRQKPFPVDKQTDVDLY